MVIHEQHIEPQTGLPNVAVSGQDMALFFSMAEGSSVFSSTGSLVSIGRFFSFEEQ